MTTYEPTPERDLTCVRCEKPFVYHDGFIMIIRERWCLDLTVTAEDPMTLERNDMCTECLRELVDRNRSVRA